MTVKVPGHINDLPKYVAGRPVGEVAREFGLDPDAIVKLASNENPLGMSASAKAAIVAAVSDTARYPDPHGHDLRQAISGMLDVPPDWIILGSGSSEILEMSGRAFLAPGDAGVYAQYGFTVYNSAIKVTGAEAIVVPARDFGHDLPAMAQAITPAVNLVFVANPNNPTGTYFSAAEFDAFMASVDGRAVVVLDEAYQEYLDPADRFDVKALVEANPNLIVSRTFSKAYGLAGLRVGYAVAQPQLIEALNKVRPTFNVNQAAQAAATAALKDLEFLQQSRTLNDAGLKKMTAFCEAHGLDYVPSKGNFVLIHVGDAAGYNQKLLRKGVIVRPVANYQLPEWLRVSIGTEAENQRFFDVMDDLLKASRD